MCLSFVSKIVVFLNIKNRCFISSFLCGLNFRILILFNKIKIIFNNNISSFFLSFMLLLACKVF
jgi:hypothetical protein